MNRSKLWYSTGRWEWEQSTGERRTLDVHEEDRQPEFTGLYDHRGAPLYRPNIKPRIGFKWSEGQ